jgi:hypothetical protein
MVRPAVAAAYQALAARLADGGTAWGGRAYAYRAPAGAARPYVVYFWSGGGDRNDIFGKRDAELVLTVKAVAGALGVAMEAAGALAELLDDAGRYDTDMPLNGGDDWVIQTSTVEGAIDMSELVDGVPVYHQGFQLRLIMEEA